MVFPKAEVVRRKNVYRITKVGERLFSELVESPQEDSDDNGFRVRLAFFRHLQPEIRIGVMERRRAVLQDRLRELKERLTSYRERVDGYTLSLMRHGMDTTEHDIRWLDGMIKAERRNGDGGASSRRAPRKRKGVTT
jgi:hypothetical protein